MARKVDDWESVVAMEREESELLSAAEVVEAGEEADGAEASEEEDEEEAK